MERPLMLEESNLGMGGAWEIVGGLNVQVKPWRLMHIAHEQTHKQFSRRVYSVGLLTSLHHTHKSLTCSNYYKTKRFMYTQRTCTHSNERLRHQYPALRLQTLHCLESTQVTVQCTSMSYVIQYM